MDSIELSISIHLMMWIFSWHRRKNTNYFVNYGILLYICIFASNFDSATCLRKYTKKDLVKLRLEFRLFSVHKKIVLFLIRKLLFGFNCREEVRDMFQHAYNGYLKYASDYDELRPLT